MRKLSAKQLLLLILLSAAAIFVCTAAGSVAVPLADTAETIFALLSGKPVPALSSASIIAFVRLPRVLNVFLVGAALSLSGAAMQGLLKNPLADGSTLGVSAGASLGAALSLAFGISLPLFPAAGTVGMAMLFAFLSLLAVLFIAFRLDHALSTNTIILTGVIFSMFMNSLISLVITFAGERAKSILFWTMGSLSGSSYGNALTILVFLLLCGTVILLSANELNAFAIGEDNARTIGVNVPRVRLKILICVSALVGVTVAVGGTIGFAGLVVPHAVRRVTGPNHRILLPVSLFVGGIFLLLADLLGRVLLRPLELPIGVITSFVGSISFVLLLFRARRGGKC